MKQNLTEALHFINSNRHPGSKTVFVSGNFNIIHPGHLRLLNFAADCGDVLVVGVFGDEHEGVIFPQDLRFEGVLALSLVNYAIKLSGSLKETLELLKPDVIVKGKEYETRFNIEEEILKSYGGKLIFGSGETKFSSVDLLKKDYEDLNFAAIHQPLNYLERHNISRGQLLAILNKMKNLSVTVIGDTIVDEYITCEPLGLSQEDPTIVVSPIISKKFIGGAGIVASHAKGFGKQVHFFSVVGDDENADYANTMLKSYGVNAHLIKDSSRPTTHKQRFRTKEKTLLRVSHLKQHSISPEIADNLFESIKAKIDVSDLVIFSDFNYGCLPTKLVERIQSYAREKNKIMVADSQSSSQIGDISRFKNMKLITPTEREARLGVGDYESGLVVLAEKLKTKANAEYVFVTMGSEGMLIHVHDVEDPNIQVTDRLLPFNAAPKDTAGAGDSMLVCASMALASGSCIWGAAYLGSLSAALQVSRLGNIPLKTEEVMTEIQR